jgi:DNA-binding NtrC family response regulator
MNFELEDVVVAEAAAPAVEVSELNREVKPADQSEPAPAGRDGLGLMAELYASLGAGEVVPLRRIKAETEIYVIGRTLERTRWNRRAAAELLKISYRGLLYKIRQYNIRPEPTVFQGNVEG